MAKAKRTTAAHSPLKFDVVLGLLAQEVLELLQNETERCAAIVKAMPTVRGRIVHSPREIAAAILKEPDDG